MADLGNVDYLISGRLSVYDPRQHLDSWVHYYYTSLPISAVARRLAKSINYPRLVVFSLNLFIRTELVYLFCFPIRSRVGTTIPHSASIIKLATHNLSKIASLLFGDGVS